MNRFIKDNMVLFIVMGGTILGALIMLVFAVVGHSQMFMYHSEAAELRSQIGDLIKQSPAPVADNVDPIRNATEFYKARTAEMLPHFGQIKGPALDVFVKTLGVDKQKFLEMFRSAWEADDSRNAVGGRSRFYERFSMGVIPNANWAADLKLSPAQSLARWAQALQAFSKEYQKLTVEEIGVHNRDDILMSVLGVPRNFEGDPDRCKREFILPLVQRMQEICAKPPLTAEEEKARAEAKKNQKEGDDPAEEEQLRVELLGNAGTFGFDLSPTSHFRKEDIADIVKNGEVIGDLVRRIATSKVSVLNSFDIRSFVLQKNFAGEKVGRYVVYHYTFSIFGDIARIRTLVNMLNAASKENRLYIVRSIFLYSIEDGAGNVMKARTEESQRLLDELDVSGDDKNNRTGRSAAAAPAAMDMGMPGAPDQHGGKQVQEKTQEQILAEERAKPYHKRSGYGKTLFGGGNNCKAVFDVEYVYLAEPELE